MKNNCFKMPHVNKKFRSLTEFRSHLNFSLSRKQRYEKNHFSLHSSFCSATKTPQIFSRVFPASKKKNWLKKDFSNSPLQVVIKTAPRYNSNSLPAEKLRRLLKRRDTLHRRNAMKIRQTQRKSQKHNQLMSGNCSQTTDEQLASSVASHGLVRLALD